MGIMTIDGQSIEFTDEPNVLSVIRKAGIDIPTLCYHSELSIYGACRLCTVENDRGKTFASCSEKPKDGMVVYTPEDLEERLSEAGFSSIRTVRKKDEIHIISHK